MAFIRNFVFIYAVTKYILIPIRKQNFYEELLKKGNKKGETSEVTLAMCAPRNACGKCLVWRQHSIFCLCWDTLKRTKDTLYLCKCRAKHTILITAMLASYIYQSRMIFQKDIYCPFSSSFYATECILTKVILLILRSWILLFVSLQQKIKKKK